MKIVNLYDCPTSKGIIVVDEEGHEFVGISNDYGMRSYEIEFENAVDEALRPYGLELHLSNVESKFRPNERFVAVKPIKVRKSKMAILKLVLTALSSKVEKYINRIILSIERNK